MDGQPVGFCFALPDLTPLFRRFNGKVGIWQILQLMLRAKKYTRGGILGIGVTEACRGKGISKALAIQLYSFYESKGLGSGLYYPVNESNTDSRGFAASIGGEGRMMYQVYDKMLG
jgi:ribosomal protein S18 acetylase RimI-like enzyme